MATRNKSRTGERRGGHPGVQNATYRVSLSAISWEACTDAKADARTEVENGRLLKPGKRKEKGKGERGKGKTRGGFLATVARGSQKEKGKIGASLDK